MRLALVALLTLAAAGILAAAIFMVARVVAGVLLAALFVGACYLALKLALKSLT